MRGILSLIFLCVTLYLANGHFYGPSQEQDQYHESEPHAYRGDRNPFHEAVMLDLEQDLSDGSKGSLRTFQKPLGEERAIFLEDRSPSVVSAGGFRDSSVSSGVETIFRKSPNTFPGFPVVIPSKSNLKEECFARQVIDLINSLVAKVNNEKHKANQTAKAYGGKQKVSRAGPQMLHAMVKELIENLHSVNGIEILDKAVSKYVKVHRIFFRMLRKNLIERGGESPEMSLALAFFSQLELLLQDFLDLSEEDSREFAPSVRLSLEFMDTILKELNGVPQAPWKKYITHLPEVQRFVEDAHTVFEALYKGFFNMKQKSEIRGSALSEILVNVADTLKELLSDVSLFDNKPGSADSFLFKKLTAFEKALSNLLEDFPI